MHKTMSDMAKTPTKSASRVWVPPEKVVPIPLRTRTQILPVNEIPWENFQRLCARLAQRSGDVEFSQEYGVPGQSQEGIDIYVRRRSSGRYSVWQCKRYQEASPSIIRGAVDEFIGGDWLKKTEEFVLCISVQIEDRELANEIEVQSARLRPLGIVLTPLGITQLSERLKGEPELVDDFFGRAWVKEFCGEDAASRLLRRILDPEQVSRLRSLLRRCYAQHFEAVDPGLPTLTTVMTRGPQPLQLAERFVIPDVLEPRQMSQVQVPSAQPPSQSQKPDASSTPATSSPESPASIESGRLVTVTTQVRRSALEWLAEGELSVIIGDPGIGKSSLLRYVLLDLLNLEPRHETLAIKWGNRLPVWIPFAMWTRLVSECESNCSLADVLTLWLRKVCASEDLVTLVQQALGDSRLLLFVDGLDEWSNETAARSTVALLEQFVGEREIPAVAGSRPLGFERLGGLSGKWRRATLAGLTRDQQREFAYRWFLHQARTSRISTSTVVDTEDQRFAEVNARELTEDIQRDGQLARLAEVPLLLSGLIALSAQRVRLPRKRFRAYEELTRLLLQEQPQRREKAAHARNASSRISPENREAALARLAYEVHQSPTSIAIDKTTACDVLAQHFVTLLHKTCPEARELAEQILAVGADTVGILVEKSPQEIGFPHRAFQEFLAARHLSNLPIAEQERQVAVLFENPQWHDVLLCLCHLNSRQGEVDAMVDVVEKVQLRPEHEHTRATFLAELAFGDLHCSASVAARLAKNAFDIIETGTWMPLRERLLEHALDGMFSDGLRDESEARVRYWYPSRHKYKRSVYRAMETWPQDAETLEALWHGLLSEDEWDQRAASEVIGGRFAGDPEIGHRLLRLLFTPSEPSVTAHVLHALCLGWSKEPKLPELLQQARMSADWGVRIAAISHRVKRQEQDSADRDALLQYGSGTTGSCYGWRDDAVDALVTGWPRDAAIKSAAIQSLISEGRPHEAPMSYDFAPMVLMRGFSQDDEVALAIADLFRRDEYPQNRMGLHGDWAPLVQSFGGHRLLRDAVDDWLENKADRWWECECTLISKSPRAKAFLLRPTTNRDVISEYQLRWLSAGWGLYDPEVAQAASKLAESAYASSIAHLLPKIVTDKAACRLKLLDWLRKANDLTALHALVGLSDLGCDEHDAEVVQAVIEKFVARPASEVLSWGVSAVIHKFPHHPRVREVAIYQINHREGEIAAVASAYAHDPEMRGAVSRQIRVLPANLRLRIVDRLARQAPDDKFAFEVLSSYDEDIDDQVKTSSAIGIARSVTMRGENQTQLIDQFANGIRAVGMDHSERRQAAFAGLLELDRLDIITNAEKTESGIIDQMEFGDYRSTNLRLAAHLAKHWNRVRQCFGGSFWERRVRMPSNFLESMATHVEDPVLLEEILEKLGKSTGVSPSAAALNILSRQWRATDQLRQLCVGLVANLCPTDWHHTAPAILAADILSEQFAHDARTIQELESAAATVPNPSALIIVLGSAWPDSPILARFKDDKDTPLLVPAEFHLLCHFAAPQECIDRLGNAFSKVTGNIWDFLPASVRPIVARFEKDGEVRDAAFRRLETNATPAEKVNLPLLLRRTDPRRDRLYAWCRAEYCRQISGKQFPNVALDICSGSLRPLSHVLLEILTN